MDREMTQTGNSFCFRNLDLSKSSYLMTPVMLVLVIQWSHLPTFLNKSFCQRIMGICSSFLHRNSSTGATWKSGNAFL
ncbi:hypothetical protein CW304_21215 [Bacillus sp. UFRGS-B20]|nr:hypothetical protein CW304_21215 [Bacillus sp. UFRGS-B20]